MTSFLLAIIAGLGAYLLVTARGAQRPITQHHIGVVVNVPRRIMAEVGVEGISPIQFVGVSIGVGISAGIATSMIFGTGVSSLIVGAMAMASPAAAWRGKRTKQRQVALDAWPRMIDEMRVLTGAAGRPVPQALLEVGLRGPVELRPAFETAQREWALTTDFERTVRVLKERLADPTADVVLETLLVAVEVGGDLESRLAALAEDRRQDELERKDAAAKQSGARFARLFVIIVPCGMALAGLNVGEGAEAYRTSTGQLLVSFGIGLIAVCWIWASRVMRLPQPIRVFDR